MVNIERTNPGYHSNTVIGEANMLPSSNEPSNDQTKRKLLTQTRSPFENVKTTRVFRISYLLIQNRKITSRITQRKTDKHLLFHSRKSARKKGSKQAGRILLEFTNEEDKYYRKGTYCECVDVHFSMITSKFRPRFGILNISPILASL